MSKEIKRIKDVESSISRNFYILSVSVSIVIMLMFVFDFFTRGAFFPTQMNLFYLGVLLIYSLHKELIRWLGNRKVERNGEYLVYTWVVLTTILYLINFLSNGYYDKLVHGDPSTTLRDLSIITLETLGVFIFTRCLKIIQLTIKSRRFD